jgi:Pentapeptide repeats (8 copies)
LRLYRDVPWAWRESGGFAGTFSPNAALVHTVIPVNAGILYTITLQWKANKSDPGTIWAGAGPINGAFSPTRLTAQLNPSAAQTGAILQYDGTNWVPIMTFCPKCNKSSTNLVAQNLSGAYFPGTDLSSTNLAYADLSFANLTAAIVSYSTLTNADFRGADLHSAHLENAYLSGTSFAYTNLAQSTFAGSNLTGADFSGASGGTTATMTSVTWSNTTCPDYTNSNNDGNTCVGHGF